MDSFVEQLVALPRSPWRTAIQLVCAAVGALAVLLCIEISLYLPMLASIFLPIALGLGYLAWRLIRRFGRVEFEYTITNGAVDIDRIIAKRVRKRMLSFQCSAVESFREETRPHASGGYDKILLLGDKRQPLYGLSLRHHKYGHVLLRLSLNDRVLDAMRRHIPRTVMQHADGRH